MLLEIFKSICSSSRDVIRKLDRFTAIIKYRIRELSRNTILFVKHMATLFKQVHLTRLFIASRVLKSGIKKN